MQLQELISTFVQPHKKPRHQLLKWRILDDDGEPVTTKQGGGTGWYHREHPDEAEMLKKLRREFRGYDVVSVPNNGDLAYCFFEARKSVPVQQEAEPVAALPKATPQKVAPTTVEMF